MKHEIMGTYVQYLRIELEPGESFYAQKRSLIYFEEGILREIAVNGQGKVRGLVSAKLAGESMFLICYINKSDSPRHLFLNCPKSVLPIDMGEGGTLVCTSGAYLASENQVKVSSKWSFKHFWGGMGLILQRIEGEGKVFLESAGTPLVKLLSEGESIIIDENHITAFEGISEDRLESKWSGSNIFAGEGVSLLRVTGPGRIYLAPGSPLDTFGGGRSGGGGGGGLLSLLDKL